MLFRSVTKTLSEAIRTPKPVDFVEQRVQRGTGDATAVALGAFPEETGLDEDDVLVLVGDVPLLRADTVAALVAHHRESDAAATLLTTHVDDPTGYGRIVRDARGGVARIVEQADATEEERAITEVNPAIGCYRRSLLAPALRRLTPANAQGELYLTDAVRDLADPAVAGRQPIRVEGHVQTGLSVAATGLQVRIGQVAGQVQRQTLARRRRRHNLFRLILHLS